MVETIEKAVKNEISVVLGTAVKNEVEKVLGSSAIIQNLEQRVESITPKAIPASCLELSTMFSGGIEDGEYSIQPSSDVPAFKVNCIFRRVRNSFIKNIFGLHSCSVLGVS